MLVGRKIRYRLFGSVNSKSIIGRIKTMHAMPLSDATRTVGSDQEKYHDLDIFDFVTEDGESCMQSAWQPTEDELKALLNGGTVRLFILGTKWPPVKIMVENEGVMVDDGDLPDDGA